MKRALLALAVGLTTLSFSVSTALADPPSPPPPPGCHSCSGPPPPPTPVPTLGAATVPVTQSIAVEVTPVKVHRGGVTKAAITASPADKVTVVVHYKSGKPSTYKLTVGASGKVVKAWKIPRGAPVGKASIAITIDPSDRSTLTHPYTTTVTIQVTK